MPKNNQKPKNLSKRPLMEKGAIWGAVALDNACGFAILSLVNPPRACFIAGAGFCFNKK